MQPSSRANGSGPRQYVDPDALFAMDVPKGWFVDSSRQMGSHVIMLDPELVNNFRSNINVVVHDLGQLSDEEFLTLTRLQLKQLPGFSLHVDHHVEGTSGTHILEWSADPGPVPLRIRQAIVLATGKAYVVTTTAHLARFEFYRDVFEAALDSFRILTPDCE